jgi:hypothetical protein
MAQSAAARATTRPTGAQRNITVPVSGTALLLIDVINDLAFEDSAALVHCPRPARRYRARPDRQLLASRPAARVAI